MHAACDCTLCCVGPEVRVPERMVIVSGRSQNTLETQSRASFAMSHKKSSCLGTHFLSRQVISGRSQNSQSNMGMWHRSPGSMRTCVVVKIRVMQGRRRVTDASTLGVRSWKTGLLSHWGRGRPNRMTCEPLTQMAGGMKWADTPNF